MNTVRIQGTKRNVLPNGLTIVSERAKGLSGLSIGFWVKTGSVNETSKEAGISHFLEHMAFKGTETRSAIEIAKSVDRVGGEFNAFTSKENTCFHILLLNKDLRLGIEVLTDILLYSKIDAEELERERKVILQEIAMVEDNPEEYVFDTFFERVFGKAGHGAHLGRSILGNESSVKRLRRGDILKYYKQNYRPDQVVIAVSGDVSHQSIIKCLGPLKRKIWPGRPTQARIKKKIQRGTPKFKEELGWKVKPTEQVHLILGMEGPKANAKDQFASTLLNVYIGNGMSSLLFQEVREKLALAYSVYSGLFNFEKTGVFLVYAAVAPSSVAACLKAIDHCLKQVKTNLLDEDALLEVKSSLKGTLLLSEDDVESRMIHLAQQEVYQEEYLTIKEITRRIDNVTPQDIKRAAHRIIKFHLGAFTFLGPKPSGAQRKKIELFCQKKIKWI